MRDNSLYAGSNHPNWQEVPSYGTAHRRIFKTLGSATKQLCVECGATAAHWAYDGLDPDELLGLTSGGSISKYSTKLERYVSLCHSCHVKKDRAESARELREYRQLKHDSKLTHSEIRAKLGL